MNTPITFLYVHFVIVQKTKIGFQDYIYVEPKPFYGTYRLAKEVRQSLINKGKLTESNSTVKGLHIIEVNLN